MRRPRLPTLLLALGLGVLGYTLSGLISVRSFLANAEQADGLVVDVRPARGGAGAPLGVVRFTTESGATVDWASAATEGYAKGDHVPVLYRVDAPGAAIVGRLWLFYGRFLVLLAIGLVLIMRGITRLRDR